MKKLLLLLLLLAECAGAAVLPVSIKTTNGVVAGYLFFRDLTGPALIMIQADGSGTNVILGANLTLVGNTLTASGGGGGGSVLFNPQFGTNAQGVMITNGASVTNFTAKSSSAWAMIAVNGLMETNPATTGYFYSTNGSIFTSGNAIFGSDMVAAGDATIGGILTNAAIRMPVSGVFGVTINAGTATMLNLSDTANTGQLNSHEGWIRLWYDVNRTALTTPALSGNYPTLPSGIIIDNNGVSNYLRMFVRSNLFADTVTTTNTGTSYWASATSIHTFGANKQQSSVAFSGSAADSLRGDGTFGTPTGVGTVTSVAMTVPSGLSVTGSPVTTSGTLAMTVTVGGTLALNTISADSFSSTNEPYVYTLTAANNATNFFLDRANGQEQQYVCTTNVNLNYLTNSKSGDVHGHVAVTFWTTNAVSPVISMPTNWHYLNTNGLTLSGSTYTFTITNNSSTGKYGRVALIGFGTGTAQSNVMAGALGGAP